MFFYSQRHFYSFRLKKENNVFLKHLSWESVLLSNFRIISRNFGISCLTYKDRSTSSTEWLRRQRRDIYVKQAGKENYRCRSAFKLLQIHERFKIFKPGFVVIDCGSAPGSWCQVAAQKVNANGEDESKPRGVVVGIDLQNMAPIEGVHLLPLCDFTKEATQNRVKALLQDKKVDVLLSDMAPAATGVRSHNHEAIVALCFSVLHFSLSILGHGGTIVCKLWSGGDQPRLEKAMRTVCDHVRIVKPDASRDDSAEIFMLGRGFRGNRKPS